MLLLLELLDVRAQPIKVELMVRRDTVELRCRDRLAGVVDRDEFRWWLGSPEGVFSYDDVTWLPLRTGVALYVGDLVSGHVLSAEAVRDLAARI